MAGAGLYAMSAHRRPLITAAASGTVLLALWFVPSAKAAPERAASPHADSASAPGTVPSPSPVANVSGQTQSPAGTRLATTGDSDTPLPYLACGLGLLGAGSTMVLRSARRPPL